MTLPMIELKYIVFEINLADRIVKTTFKSNRSKFCCGTREDNEENRREAELQGYYGEDRVWRSLVHHEFLHSLLPEILFSDVSNVLIVEARACIHPTPTWRRYYEEALVLSFQIWSNTGIRKLPLDDPRLVRLEELETKWKYTYEPELEGYL